jgi:hypothetical protein
MGKLYSSSAAQPRFPIYAWRCFSNRRLGTNALLLLLLFFLLDLFFDQCHQC